MREKSGLHETERQLQLKIRTLQSCLKTEKDEVFPTPLSFTKMFDTWTVCRCHKLSIWLQVQKLQSIIASRATQYSHDAKRKEREAAKLKERLSQLLVDRKDKKLGNSTLLQYRLMNSSKTMNDPLTYYCSKKLSMYWIAWDEQMEKGATGKPQKQQPGTLKASLTMSVANAIIKLITREFGKLFCAATKEKCTSPC